MSTYYHTPHWRELRLAALRRDRFTCTTPGCGERAKVVDHIQTRPRVTHPTEFDVLSNLRSLCKRCDDQVKELGTKRKGQAQPRAVGCDQFGNPRDPHHPWAAGKG